MERVRTLAAIAGVALFTLATNASAVAVVCRSPESKVVATDTLIQTASEAALQASAELLRPASR